MKNKQEDYRDYSKENRYIPVNICHMDDMDFHNIGCIDYESEEFRWLNIGNVIDELNFLDKKNKELEREKDILKKLIDYDKRTINSYFDKFENYNLKISDLEMKSFKLGRKLIPVDSFLESKGISIYNIEEAFNKVWEDNRELVSENWVLKRKLIDNMALVILLSNTTVSGRVDNIIFNRGNYSSEEEYYNDLNILKKRLYEELF